MQELWSARISAQRSKQHFSRKAALFVGLAFILICLAALAAAA